MDTSTEYTGEIILAPYGPIKTQFGTGQLLEPDLDYALQTSAFHGMALNDIPSDDPIVREANMPPEVRYKKNSLGYLQLQLQEETEKDETQLTQLIHYMFNSIPIFDAVNGLTFEGAPNFYVSEPIYTDSIPSDEEKYYTLTKVYDGDHTLQLIKDKYRFEYELEVDKIECSLNVMINTDSGPQWGRHDIGDLDDDEYHVSNGILYIDTDRLDDLIGQKLGEGYDDAEIILELSVPKYKEADSSDDAYTQNAAAMQGIHASLLEYYYQFNLAAQAQENLNALAYTMAITFISTIATMGISTCIGKAAGKLGAKVSGKRAGKMLSYLTDFGDATAMTIAGAVMNEMCEESLRDPFIESFMSNVAEYAGGNEYHQAIAATVGETGRETLSGIFQTDAGFYAYSKNRMENHQEDSSLTFSELRQEYREDVLNSKSQKVANTWTKIKIATVLISLISGQVGLFSFGTSIGLSISSLLCLNGIEGISLKLNLKNLDSYIRKNNRDNQEIYSYGFPYTGYNYAFTQMNSLNEQSWGNIFHEDLVDHDVLFSLQQNKELRWKNDNFYYKFDELTNNLLILEWKESIKSHQIEIINNYLKTELKDILPPFTPKKQPVLQMRFGSSGKMVSYANPQNDPTLYQKFLERKIIAPYIIYELKLSVSIGNNPFSISYSPNTQSSYIGYTGDYMSPDKSDNIRYYVNKRLYGHISSSILNRQNNPKSQSRKIEVAFSEVIDQIIPSLPIHIFNDYSNYETLSLSKQNKVNDVIIELLISNNLLEMDILEFSDTKKIAKAREIEYIEVKKTEKYGLNSDRGGKGGDNKKDLPMRDLAGLLMLGYGNKYSKNYLAENNIKVSVITINKNLKQFLKEKKKTFVTKTLIDPVIKGLIERDFTIKEILDLYDNRNHYVQNLKKDYRRAGILKLYKDSKKYRIDLNKLKNTLSYLSGMKIEILAKKLKVDEKFLDRYILSHTDEFEKEGLCIIYENGRIYNYKNLVAYRLKRVALFFTIAENVKAEVLSEFVGMEKLELMRLILCNMEKLEKLGLKLIYNLGVFHKVR